MATPESYYRCEGLFGTGIGTYIVGGKTLKSFKINVKKSIDI